MKTKLLGLSLFVLIITAMGLYQTKSKPKEYQYCSKYSEEHQAGLVIKRIPVSQAQINADKLDLWRSDLVIENHSNETISLKRTYSHKNETDSGMIKILPHSKFVQDYWSQYNFYLGDILLNTNLFCETTVPFNDFWLNN